MAPSQPPRPLSWEALTPCSLAAKLDLEDEDGSGLHDLFQGLPPMSHDGGSEEEFQEHWAFWQHPRRLSGGWIERRIHPQVAPSKPSAFWFHRGRACYAFDECPLEAEGVPEEDASSKLAPSLRSESKVWHMTCAELKAALAEPGVYERLAPKDLAQRALHEYESFLPRVQSWHDYQHRTFWFLSHEPGKGFARESFASDAFYLALAALAVSRLKWIHPVNIAYLTWTFSRPMVIVPEFLKAVGDHLVGGGLLPLLDRCGLCTLAWCYWKMGTHHRQLFDAMAAEIKRPARLRSLAPRNFQNCMIAFSRLRYSDLELVERLMMGVRRLLDNHDPISPKTDKSVLFSYTCLDGSEVPADAFRINSLTVILNACEEFRLESPHLDRCYVSMASYVLRSLLRSPPMMRSDSDAADFVAALARAAVGRKRLKAVLDPFLQLLPEVLSNASLRSRARLCEAFNHAGLDVDI